jgi:hypothetical protein
MRVSRLLVAILLQLRSVHAQSSSGGSSICHDSKGNTVACPFNKTAIIAGVVIGAGKTYYNYSRIY